MNKVLDVVKNEPVVITGVIGAVLALLLAFGFDITSEQTGTIMAVAVAVLALIGRIFVTPTNKLKSEPPVEDAA